MNPLTATSSSCFISVFQKNLYFLNNVTAVNLTLKSDFVISTLKRNKKMYFVTHAIGTAYQECLASSK